MNMRYNPLTDKLDLSGLADSEVRALISSIATGLTYTPATGVLSLTSGYVIPTTTEESNWNTAFGWGQGLKLDQTTPQTVSNGVPIFDAGLQSNGNVGIGATPDVDHLLYMTKTRVNATNRGINSSAYSSVTSAGDYRIMGANYWTQELYTTTANNTGGLYGMINYALSSRVSGQINALYGNQTYYGVYSYFSGTVKSAFGLYIGSYRYGGSTPGTITNVYDMYIRSPLLNATPANVTNDWCIYSLHNAPSRFVGKLQIDSDTNGLELGAGQDVGTYYNGTNWIFDSRLVGTGNYIFNGGTIFINNIKSGATQAGSGAGAGEVWKTASHASLPDNVLMIGV